MTTKDFSIVHSNLIGSIIETKEEIITIETEMDKKRNPSYRALTAAQVRMDYLMREFHENVEEAVCQIPYRAARKRTADAIYRLIGQ